MRKNLLLSVLKNNGRSSRSNQRNFRKISFRLLAEHIVPLIFGGFMIFENFTYHSINVDEMKTSLEELNEAIQKGR